MPDPTRFRTRYGPWAVVTGASSGIGLAFCRELAARGFHLVAAARRIDRLEALRDELGAAHGVTVVPCQADLGAAEGRGALFEAAAPHEVGLCVANAGFGLKGRFTEIPLARMLQMVELNCAATLEVSHHFAARLEAQGRGGLVITSSTAAFQGIPFTAAYAASKGFCLQLAEGLWYELRPKGVDVVALCPGPVDTEGPKNSGVDPAKVPTKMMDPLPVARQALGQLGRGPISIPGATNRLAAFASRFLPRRTVTGLAGRIIARVTS